MFAIDSDSDELGSTPNMTGSPERRLLLAILERAILDFLGNEKAEVDGANEWIFGSELDEEQEFSFAWVCRQLDLDPAFVSSQIEAMPKRGTSRIPPWYINRIPPSIRGRRLKARKRARLNLC